MIEWKSREWRKGVWLRMNEQLKTLNSEFDWFALDREGYVGHFSSGGGHILPQIVRSYLSEQLTLDKYFMELSLSKSAQLVRTDENREDWLKMAQRGLYSFDFNHWNGPYILIAKPDKPISKSDLPTEIAKTLELFQFEKIDFEHKDSIESNEFF
jgi:hypothetical protein